MPTENFLNALRITPFEFVVPISLNKLRRYTTFKFRTTRLKNLGVGVLGRVDFCYSWASLKSLCRFGMFVTCRAQKFSGPPRLTIQNNMPTMGSKRYLADALDSVNTEYLVNLKVPIDTV